MLLDIFVYWHTTSALLLLLLLLLFSAALLLELTFRQFWRLRKSATAAGLFHWSCTVSCIRWLWQLNRCGGVVPLHIPDKHLICRWWCGPCKCSRADSDWNATGQVCYGHANQSELLSHLITEWVCWLALCSSTIPLLFVLFYKTAFFGWAFHRNAPNIWNSVPNVVTAAVPTTPKNIATLPCQILGFKNSFKSRLNRLFKCQNPLYQFHHSFPVTSS